MSDLEQQNFTNKPRNRRAIVKGAAWSVPVIAAAIAAPAASASTANAGIAWTASSSSLVNLRVLDSATVVTAQVLPTVPTAFTITNGAGAISGPATVTIRVDRPSGINISLGRARGFGVYSYAGVPTPSGTREAVYQKTPIVLGVGGIEYGFPLTTYTATQNVTVDSNGQLVVPVEFALAGRSDLVAISALANFPVTLTVAFADGNTYTASTVVSVPVGAGVL
ncbi:hypothetical protein AS189_16465 [Arthrobacter alpinus]|uniref:Uncharacterized protein n=1 Tax=Arthrobacter alpinus TaxID=656366 RepID=A0A0S2M2I7_9MICC|nr:hypothetical protein [Arthrobacter alpinus]ALO67782.1 hypothetical protein AS189_16465 [Arthrobacter alpinus]